VEFRPRPQAPHAAQGRGAPRRLRPAPLKKIKTVREFDETYTAPYFGFRDAEDYYHRASAMRVIDRVSIPALVITAADDPFVPSQPFHDPKVTGNTHIDLRLCTHGGHCGFVGSRSAQDDGYWAEKQIVDSWRRDPYRRARKARGNESLRILRDLCGLRGKTFVRASAPRPRGAAED
jgi:predicted alpha/beta-fold hydrolase